MHSRKELGKETEDAGLRIWGQDVAPEQRRGLPESETHAKHDVHSLVDQERK